MIESPKPKIVLGFSGGLDTSFCVKYLSEEKGMDVHTITINTGGFSTAELAEIERLALSLGATSHKSVDARKSYYDSIIRFLVFGNVLKNNTYPLSVSAERLSQAMHIASYAKQLGASHVAHGSTGAGNDQVRFDLILQLMAPHATIVTPIRELKLSREEEIAYLKKSGVDLPFKKAAYSINKGLWGTSIGGRETLQSCGIIPEEAWPSPLKATQPQKVALQFTNGHLTGVDDIKYTHPVEAIEHLAMLASPFAIGRDIHVGDTIIGIKGRVAFEAAAPLIIIKSHHALEKHTLTKWQLTLKDQLAQFYGNSLHEGQILDPVMRDIEAFFIHSQQYVSGTVHVQLHPYRFVIEGIESPHDLMRSEFGQYGEMNNTWSGDDVRGFTKIFGNQTSMYYAIHPVNLPNYD